MLKGNPDARPSKRIRPTYCTTTPPDLTTAAFRRRVGSGRAEDGNPCPLSSVSPVGTTRAALKTRGRAAADSAAWKDAHRQQVAAAGRDFRQPAKDDPSAGHAKSNIARPPLPRPSSVSIRGPPDSSRCRYPITRTPWQNEPTKCSGGTALGAGSRAAPGYLRIGCLPRLPTPCLTRSCPVRGVPHPYLEGT